MSLSNIAVAGAGSATGADGFDVGAATQTISGSSAQFVPGVGFHFTGGGLLQASNLTAVNVSSANAAHEAFWFGGTGFSSVSDLTAGVLNGAITHFANGMSPMYAFAAGTFNVVNTCNK